MIKNSENELGYKNIDSLLIQYSIPTIISVLVIIIQGITDRYFIGKYVGVYGMDATAVLFPLVILVSAISALLLIGGGNQFAINLGENKPDLARKIYSLSITLAILFGILYSFIILPFSKPIIFFFGATEQTYRYVQDYNITTTPFAVFQILFALYTTYIRIDGKPKLSTFYGVVNIVINIFLNYILMAKLNWGILGAGIATSLSSFILVIIMVFSLKKNPLLFFNFKELHFSISETKKIINIGSASFINQILNAITTILMNRQLIEYGTPLSLTSFAIISMARNLLNLASSGIMQGRSPILSFNFGAKKFDRVISVTNKSVTYAVLFSVILTTLTIIFSKQFTSLFISDNPELIKITATNMKYHLSFMFSTALYLTTASYFQGIGEGKITLNLTIFRLVIVFIPLLTILPKFFGELGVWISFPIGETISALVSFYMMRKSLKNLKSSIPCKN